MTTLGGRFWTVGTKLVAYGQEPGEVSASADAAASRTRINDTTMDATDTRNRRNITANLLEVRHGRELSRPHGERLDDLRSKINYY